MVTTDGPLHGLRILDFSALLAGPYACSLLAMLGAEVIRIETSLRPDYLRGHYKGRFHEANLNKRSISLNLKHKRAVEVAKALVGISDAVVENYRPGVVTRWGLSYDVLSEINPQLVMLSISGYGQEGEERDLGAFAAIFSAMGGLADLTGYTDGLPGELRGGMDMRVGQVAAFALLPALYNARQTGRGQYIDLAGRDVSAEALGELFLEHPLTGRVPRRCGNEQRGMAPHNCYPCREEDHWVSIAVSNDAEWQALCSVATETNLAANPLFATGMSRWEHREELDTSLSAWTRTQERDTLWRRLQAAGVAAFPSVDAGDVYADLHLRERGYVYTAEHADLGSWQTMGPPWHFSELPSHVERLGMGLGEDNDFVLRQLLDLGDEEIRSLIADGALA